eukprot:TRINITY_DN31219_c0_g1_i1.p1 TRINITY_DN31219_c0_g1~~TRINITY_DN31219_c0_g1_i1.p1  ORF type:complete len:221 (-),score=48.77 TRINITY_DN31219_c0_g1_i1:282-872(-)
MGRFHQMGALIFLVACAIGTAVAYPKFGEQVQYNNTAQLTSNYKLDWSVQDNVIYFQLTLNAGIRAWTGIGVHPVGSSYSGMRQADIMLSLFDDATGALINVTDAWAPAEMMPNFDENVAGCTDDIIPGSASGSQDLSSNVTVSRWARKLVTSDVNCDNPIKPGTLQVIFAHGQSNTFGYHGYTNAGVIMLTLTDN